jgi:hypothetical protein
LLLKPFAPDLSDRLPQPIAEFLQPALNPKTMVTDFTVQLPFKSGPQKERADARAFAKPRANEAIALRKMPCVTPETSPAAEDWVIENGFPPDRVIIVDGSLS